MAGQVSNIRLNDLLIEIGRSLTQYAAESWLWSGEGAEQTRAVVQRLVDGQREAVGRLANLLAERGCSIDFGTYPTEYTSLHYVALDFLIRQLIENQNGVIAECEALLMETQGDPQAYPLLQQILASERSNLDELRKLAADPQAWVVV